MIYQCNLNVFKGYTADVILKVNLGGGGGEGGGETAKITLNLLKKQLTLLQNVKVMLNAKQTTKRRITKV